ncbi:hypothetical protein ACJX0J_026321, partial [Zea mays]
LTSNPVHPSIVSICHKRKLEFRIIQWKTPPLNIWGYNFSSRREHRVVAAAF